MDMKNAMAVGSKVTMKGADSRTYQGEILALENDHNDVSTVAIRWTIHRGRRHFTEVELMTVAYFEAQGGTVTAQDEPVRVTAAGNDRGAGFSIPSRPRRPVRSGRWVRVGLLLDRRF